MTPTLYEWLRQSPLTGIFLTLLAYRVALSISRRYHGHPLANTVLVGAALLIASLLALGLSFDEYFRGASFIQFLLGPVTVALAIPLYNNLARLKRSAFAILCSIVVGSVAGVASAVLIAVAFDMPSQIVLSLAPRSATTPIAIGVAEAIGGSEENFVQMMNREAQRLGMRNSHFTNATGLPDPQHYTTVRDLSILTAALVRDFPEEYAKYYSVKEFRYNNITQPNRNRLLWIDPTVDGVKTGHTEAAGYCLISSSKRGPRRLISVVVGTNSDATRASESLKLLNWGFQFYEAVQLYGKGQPVSSLRVWKGSENTVKAGFTQDFIVAVPKGYADKIQAQFVSQQPLMAPVAQGQKVGTVKVTIDGKPYGDYPVEALETVPVAGFFGRLWDTIRLWFA